MATPTWPRLRSAPPTGSSLFEGDGAGALSFAGALALAMGGLAQGLCLADLDGDGRSDLAVVQPQLFPPAQTLRLFRRTVSASAVREFLRFAARPRHRRSLRGTRSRRGRSRGRFDRGLRLPRRRGDRGCRPGRRHAASRLQRQRVQFQFESHGGHQPRRGCARREEWLRRPRRRESGQRRPQRRSGSAAGARAELRRELRRPAAPPPASPRSATASFAVRLAGARAVAPALFSSSRAARAISGCRRARVASIPRGACHVAPELH